MKRVSISTLTIAMAASLFAAPVMAQDVTSIRQPDSDRHRGTCHRQQQRRRLDSGLLARWDELLQHQLQRTAQLRQ
jgi:hypothetical protein